MSIFSVNGVNYTHSKLDTKTQLHASRKGAPLFIGVANSQWFQILHDMSEEDLDYLLHLIMPFVSRQETDGGFAPIYNKQQRVYLYPDIGGGEVLEIVFQVLLDYLPDFITAAGRMVLGTPSPQTETPDTQN